MDCPFAFDPERSAASCRRGIACWILEVAERPVDRSETICSAGDHHARERCVPLVSRVIRIEAADVYGTRPTAGSVVGNPEVHRLEPPARLRNRLDVGHAERSLDKDV